MRAEIVAIIFNEGGKILSALLRNRPQERPPTVEYLSATVSQETQETIEQPRIEEGKATSIATGCVPCALGHLGPCTGLLNEAMRFARKEGIESNEVIDRVNICMDELNALERVDLRPELTLTLPPWEKELADKALTKSREIRHALEGISTVDDLERVAAITQTTRQEIGREWFSRRLSKVSRGEKVKVIEKTIEKLKQEDKVSPAQAKQLEDLEAMRGASRIKG